MVELQKWLLFQIFTFTRVFVYFQIFFIINFYFERAPFLCLIGLYESEKFCIIFDILELFEFFTMCLSLGPMLFAES